MYALDTNLLVYAHNTASPFHTQAKAFVEQVMNTRDAEGQLSICQILMEFLNVITWHRLETPLPLTDALRIVQDYIDTGVTILSQQPTQLETLIDFLKLVSTRNKIFDVALVATLKNRYISGLYTINTQYFNRTHVLDVPLFRGRYKSIMRRICLF